MIPFSTVSHSQRFGLQTNLHKAMMLMYNQYNCLHDCSYTEIDVSDGVDDSTLGNVSATSYTYSYTRHSCIILKPIAHSEVLALHVFRSCTWSLHQQLFVHNYKL